MIEFVERVDACLEQFVHLEGLVETGLESRLVKLLGREGIKLAAAP